MGYIFSPLCDSLKFILYISSMKSKTATIFVSGNECLFLSTSFFLALLHDGSVPIIVGTMNNYVHFLFEIKSHFAKTGYNHHKYIDLVTDGCIIIRQSYGLPYNDLLV